MLTTAEIASELYISTNTVKSHIKNICHKLAATHRGEAVRRARQLQADLRVPPGGVMPRQARTSAWQRRRR